MVGSYVGESLAFVGSKVGSAEGLLLGSNVGSADGAVLGCAATADGSSVSVALGPLVGAEVVGTGAGVGPDSTILTVGLLVGDPVGVPDSWMLPTSEGGGVLGGSVAGGKDTGTRGSALGAGLAEGMLEAQKRPSLWLP